MQQHRRAAQVMAGAVGLVVALGFAGQQPKPSYQPRATPGPRTFGAANVTTVPLTTIQQFVRDDLAFDTTLGAADEQLVDFEAIQIGTERAKPARIEPEIRSYALDTVNLARGRVIARIRSEAVVKSLGIGPWWTWWWVDRKGPRGTWRSVFIPESEKAGNRVILRDTLMLMRHAPDQWRQGIARFWIVRGPYGGRDPIWIESWGTCGGCCRQILVVGGGL